MTTLKDCTALAAALWPHPPWPGEVQKLWAESVADIPADVIAQAIRNFYASDSKGFRPTPGQIRALVEGSGADLAERGWRALCNAIAFYASKPTNETPDMPEFIDARVPTAIRAIGGFRQFLGGVSVDQGDWTRKRFISAFNEAGAPKLSSGEVRRLR